MRVSLNIIAALIVGLLIVSGMQTCRLHVPEDQSTILHGGLER